MLWRRLATLGFMPRCQRGAEAFMFGRPANVFSIAGTLPSPSQTVTACWYRFVAFELQGLALSSPDIDCVIKEGTPTYPFDLALAASTFGLLDAGRTSSHLELHGLMFWVALTRLRQASTVKASESCPISRAAGAERLPTFRASRISEVVTD